MLRWESDDGTKWNNFDATLCSLLENARSSGQHQFQIPERSWLFDLSAMTQTNVKVRGTLPLSLLSQPCIVTFFMQSLSTRKVQRIQAGEPTGCAAPHQATASIPAVMGYSSQQLPNVSSISTPLPAGWIEQIDSATGSPYYVNTATKQSSWDRPVATSSIPPPAPHHATPLPAGWIQQIDPATGSPFYVNTATGQSSWHAPASPAGSTLAASSSDSCSHTSSHAIAALHASSLHSESASGQAASSLLNVAHAFSALSVQAPVMQPMPSSIPESKAVWKWESDDGSMFNDFQPDVSASLERAIASGQPTFQIPERSWFFDFASMTQSNYKTHSKRRIRRLSALSAAAATNPVAESPALLLSNPANFFCTSAAQPDQAAQSLHLPALSAAQQMWASSGASKSLGASLAAPQMASSLPSSAAPQMASSLPSSAAPQMASSLPSSAAPQMAASSGGNASLDFDAAIGKLVVAAKGIPIDIVYGIYVRKGHDVELAQQLLVQINQLRDMCADKFSYSDIAAAMVATSDSYEATLEMLLQQLPEEAPEEPAPAPPEPAPAPDPEPSDAQEEKAACVICWENPPTHAFIPCGHKHICGKCNDDKATVDGLKGKCPTCSTPFSMILHIYEG